VHACAAGEPLLGRHAIAPLGALLVLALGLERAPAGENLEVGRPAARAASSKVVPSSTRTCRVVLSPPTRATNETVCCMPAW
jgi:hypothetical protein